MIDFIEQIIDNLTTVIINKSSNDIQKKSLGFVTKDNGCDLNIMCITLHAVENSEIFNDTQNNNIINVYNSIKYVK